MAFAFLEGVSSTSSPLRFLGVAGVVVAPVVGQQSHFLATSQTLHTSLLGNDRAEHFSIFFALLELFGLGNDGAELMLEAAGCASTIDR